MRFSLLRSLLTAAVFSVCASRLEAQQRPTSDQARELLRTRPELVQQLRQRIGASGLTPDQIRARLRAEGYPENLLDAYLSGSSVPADSVRGGPEVFEAVRALGLADSTDVDELPYDTLGAPRRSGRRPPSALDTGSADDTLAFGDTLPAYLRQRMRVEADSGYRIFGLDIFRGSTSQFDANAAGPVDANYRLGPGDRLVLVLTGDVEASYTLDVTREGFVVVPQVGQLYVANLTIDALESLLYSRLSRVYSGIGRGPGASTRFSVSPARLRSNQVFVTGDVRRPGSYRISGAGTALTALYAAGGPTENGSLRRILVRRGGRIVDSLDVYDYLLRGDASHDARLQNGDVVFVPVHGARARIVGQVTRPATYELKESELLDDLIRAAGGFTAEASTRRVQVERIVPPAEREAAGRDRVVIDVTAGAGDARAVGSTLPVRNGDIVRVFEVAERVRNRVTVIGNVWEPGSVGFRPGMRLSEALRAAGGVRPDVYLGQVLVSRMRADSSRIQLRSSFADTTGRPVDDLELREDDEVRVFSVRSFRPQRYVTIVGAVRRGGRYPYREGMTLRDLALLAGGLDESAYLQEAEIARLPETRANGVTATTFRVPLDSSYVFERGPDGRYLGPPGLPAPAAGAAEVALVPYDNVLIMHQPDWELQRLVFVGGEVQFPGVYALRSKRERLRDVIARAGGLTREAYPEGVRFTRSENRTGRIGIDLPSVLRDGAHVDNVLLLDGDSIEVPRYNAVVTVGGAVNSPVAVTFVPGRDLDYYIAAAGGGSRKADLGRAYVTQPNGKVESRSGRRRIFGGPPEPRAGSVVFVPERDPADRKDWAAIVGNTAQVLASLVAIVVVIARN